MKRPQHAVTIPQPFAVGKYPVTFAEWGAYVALAGSSGLFRPVINVSWDDAQAYAKWLST
ncbi:MAG: formylglycine-generating enzyme family protein [Dichotomicrobium sp.]